MQPIVIHSKDIWNKLEFGKEDEFCIFLMDYIPGTLPQVIKKTSKYSLIQFRYNTNRIYQIKSGEWIKIDKLFYKNSDLGVKIDPDETTIRTYFQFYSDAIAKFTFNGLVEDKIMSYGGKSILDTISDNEYNQLSDEELKAINNNSVYYEVKNL